MTAGSLAVFRPPGALADLLLTALLALIFAAFVLVQRTGLFELEVRRRLPRVATKGEAIAVVHEVVNPTGRLIRNVFVTEVPAPAPSDALPAGRSGTFFPEILPRLRAEAKTRLFVGRRGPLRLDGVTVEAGDPFGVFALARFVELPGELLVQPRPRRTIALATLASDVQRAALEGGAGEWSRVREWRAGDPLRSVHWRLTARRGVPIVKTVDLPRDQMTMLVLDRRPASGRRGRAVFEQAVSLAAGLGLALLEKGAVLSFAAPGAEHPISLEGLRGRAGGSRLLECLALVRLDAAGLDAPVGRSGLRPERSALITSRDAGAVGRAFRIVIQARSAASLPPRVVRNGRTS